MIINNYSFYNYDPTFLKEFFLSSLSDREKKILAIASVAFALLASSFYILCHYFIRAKNIEDSLPDDSILEESVNNEDEEKLINEDGSIYEGEFKDNPDLTGKGKITDPDGSIFEGQFKYCKLNGEGKITFAGGLYLEGEFKDNKLNGKGKMIAPESMITSDKLNDPDYITDDDKLVIIEGYFKNNIFEGQGTMTYADGTILDGEFKLYRLNGPGKITFSNKVILEGVFNDGKLNGKGKRIFADGKEEEGIYKDGILQKK